MAPLLLLRACRVPPSALWRSRRVCSTATTATAARERLEAPSEIHVDGQTYATDATYNLTPRILSLLDVSAI